MLKAYKYRIYPNAAQSILIDEHINACRFVYNLALETKCYAFRAHRKNLSCYDLHKQLVDLKNESRWLINIDSQCLQQSIIDMDTAFNNYFKKSALFPKFKKKSSAGSFRNPHGDRVRISNNKVFFCKFRKGIKIAQDRTFDGEVSYPHFTSLSPRSKIPK